MRPGKRERPDVEIGAPVAGEAASSVTGNAHAFVVLRGCPEGVVRYFQVPSHLLGADLLERHHPVLTRDALWWVVFPHPWGGPYLLDDLRRAHPGSILIDEYAYQPDEVLDGDNRLGDPIELGRDSGTIEGFVQLCARARLHPDRIVELTNWRGDDCGWGAGTCPNSPCPDDAREPGRATCRELWEAFPDRRRAGESMRHDGVIPSEHDGTRPVQLRHGATVTAADLPGLELRTALAVATHRAFDSGRAAVVVGANRSAFVICTEGCCVRAHGVFVVIPPGVELDTAATGGHPPAVVVGAHQARGRVAGVPRPHQRDRGEVVTDPLVFARRLIDQGAPVFLAYPKADRAGEFHYPRGWEKTTPNPRLLEAYEPGMAVCAVTGVALDVIDIDPRNGGDKAWESFTGDYPSPRVYAEISTPSGGRHLYIARTHHGKVSRDGIDLQAGDDHGHGRGFVFLPGTERPSKATGEVRPLQRRQHGSGRGQRPGPDPRARGLGETGRGRWPEGGHVARPAR